MRRVIAFKRNISRNQLCNSFTASGHAQRQASDEEDEQEIETRSLNPPQTEVRKRPTTSVKEEGSCSDTINVITTSKEPSATASTAPSTSTTPSTAPFTAPSPPDVNEPPREVEHVEQNATANPSPYTGNQYVTETHAILQWFHNWSANPDGKVFFYWKAFLTMIVMYNCAVVILRTAFKETREERLFMWMDYVGDIVYLVDIFVDSKTSYLQNGCVIDDPSLMWKNYLCKGHFINDILAILPTQIVYTVVTVFLRIIGSEAIAGSTIGRFLDAYQPVLRLNRLIKCHAMSKFFHRTESRTNSPNILRAFRLGLQLALVIHWIACLYYMLSEYEGHGTTDWTYPTGPQYDKFYRKYIICMYWSTMTLTTIGERPSPSTDLEYVFTGFTFMVGVFVFAAVVGNVGDVISNTNAARRDFQSRMDQIKFYLNHRNVPDHLQTRIKRWAEYTWDRTKAVDEQSVLQLLPDRIRTEVAIHVHLNVLKKVSIFDECEEGLLRELVLKLKPQIFSPGDYICRIGEIGREMYIINHGQVEILYPDSETNVMRRVAVMHPGNFFGEISLLKLDDGQNKRTADVRSIGFSELLCLSRRDLMVALTEYPEAKRILEEYAKERFRQTKKPADETDESVDGSRRGSSVSSGSPLNSASQVFARVMKREGFSKLLQRKDTDLMAIKSAVEELKASKSAEIQENLVIMKRKIQELDRSLSERNIQLQEAYAQIAYLNSINLRLNQKRGMCPDATHSHESSINLPSPEIRQLDLCDNSGLDGFSIHNERHSENSHLLPSNKVCTSPRRDSSFTMPQTESDILCQIRRSSFRSIGNQKAQVTSSDHMVSCSHDTTPYGSSDGEDGSDTDMDSLERKFEKIGKKDYSSEIDDLQRRLDLINKSHGQSDTRIRHSETFCDLFSGSSEVSRTQSLNSGFKVKISRSLTALNTFTDPVPDDLQRRSNLECKAINEYQSIPMRQVGPSNTNNSALQSFEAENNSEKVDRSPVSVNQTPPNDRKNGDEN